MSHNDPSPRLDIRTLAPAAHRAYLAFHTAVEGLGLERGLLELIKIRASQINGCAFCLDMHTIDARAHGEREQRIYALSAWREAPFFSARERAALAWTEAVTHIATAHPSDAAFAAAKEQFDEAELAALTLAIVAINGWNRIAITSGAVAGTYRPATTG
jgi:AhpD family alkylhydroperoxidase